MARKTEISVVTQRGRVSIPADLRRELHLAPGRGVRWEEVTPAELRVVVLPVKSTYSLDPETLRALDSLARRWQVSRSEALRRAICGAAACAEPERPDPLRALDRLQEKLALSRGEAQRWERGSRAERRAASEHRGR